MKKEIFKLIVNIIVSILLVAAFCICIPASRELIKMLQIQK